MQISPLLYTSKDWYTKHAQRLDTPTDMQVVFSIEELLQHPPSICLIAMPSDKQDEALVELHQSGRSFEWQLYVHQTSSLSDALSDGLWPTQEWSQLWERHLDRLSCTDNVDLNPMLIWLWLNPTRRLIPVKSKANTLYYYPLLQAYYPELDSVSTYLASRTKQKVLVEDALIDRTRHCQSCHSGYLNYVETCPSCQSVDIDNQLSLHCFTCGHIAPQSAFQHTNQLKCPKCLTQLRHIGVDYDRPLETHHCNQCHTQFIEAQTVARCLDCSHTNDINELEIQQHKQYRIGENVEFLILDKEKLSLPSLSLDGKTDSTTLHTLLPWLNKLATRHRHSHLLLGLHLPKFNDMAERLSFRKAVALNEQLDERLNGVLRNTDLCCHYRSDFIFLFMPVTDEKSLTVLQNRIVGIAQTMEEQNFTLKVYSWTLPDDSLKDDGQEWLQSLVNEIVND